MGEFYTLVVRYEGNKVGNLSIYIEEANDMQTYSINSQNMSLGGVDLISNSYGIHTHFFKLAFNISGIFHIFAYSPYNDTTLRIYDDKGNLQSQSFDPLADWSEDYPDLNAKLRFHNDSYGRPAVYYLEVSIVESNKEIITQVSKEFNPS